MPTTFRFALLALLAVAALATPAAVFAYQTQVTITSAQLISKSQILITGTVDCSTDGVTYAVRVSADQGSGGRVHGNGGTGEVTCVSAGLQTWSAVAHNVAANYRGGRVTVTADASRCRLIDPVECPDDPDSYGPWVTMELRLTR